MLYGTNSKRVIVARNCARTSGVTFANLNTKLGPGEVIITDQNGKILNTAALAKAAKAIILHVGTNEGRAFRSDVIRAKQVKKYFATKFINQSEKKVYIGWNGTAGSIDLIDANDYILTMEHTSTHPAYEAHPYVTGANYTSKITGGTQYEVAKNIVDLLVLNYSQFEPFVIANVVGDVTTGGSAATGASVITGADTVSYTGGTAPVVGDKLSIPGYADPIYGTELDSIYSVVAVDLTNKVITLDRVYQNASQDAITVTVVSAGTDYGIELKGVRQGFRLGYGDLIVIDWDTLLKNFGDSTVTTTNPVYSTGRHEKVAMDEFLFQGEAGRFRDNEFQFHKPLQEWIKDHGYSALQIEFESGERINTLEVNGQPKSLTIWLDRSTYTEIAANAAGTAFGTNIQTGTGADTVNGDSLLNVLNAFMVGAEVIVTGVNSVANGGASITAGTTFNTGIDV